MIKRVIAGIKYVLGLYPPGRNLAVFPDDIFIVSYPKSGNTWTRFLVGNLLHPVPRADFSNINEIVPDPEALTIRHLARMPRPRFIKSHQYFDPRYRKIIYVVRDPRDVVLSQYHFHRKRKLLRDDSSLEQFVARFVAGKTSVYGSWGENVASWLATRGGSPEFLLLRYEDMLENTVRELSKVASFLGMQPTADQLALAVAQSSAAEMRKLEKSQAHLWSSIKDTRQDVPFIREARAGGWKTELPFPQVQTIEATWSEIMKYLGYDLRSGSEDRRPTFCSKFSEGSLNGVLR